MFTHISIPLSFDTPSTPHKSVKIVGTHITHHFSTHPARRDFRNSGYPAANGVFHCRSSQVFVASEVGRSSGGSNTTFMSMILTLQRQKGKKCTQKCSFRKLHRSLSCHILRYSYNDTRKRIKGKERKGKKKKIRLEQQKEKRVKFKCSTTILTFGRSRIWFASNSSSSKLLEYRRMSSGTHGKEQWRLSTYSTCLLHPLKIGMQRNMVHYSLSQSR